MWEIKFYTHIRPLLQLPLCMHRRMVHVTTDAILRVVQPPFVVCSSVGRISFKIFQIPELDEVTENRAWRRAEGRGQRALRWLDAFNSDWHSSSHTRRRSATRLTHLTCSHRTFVRFTNLHLSCQSLYSAIFNRSSFETNVFWAKEENSVALSWTKYSGNAVNRHKRDWIFLWSQKRSVIWQLTLRLPD